MNHSGSYPNWKENGRIKLMIIVGTRPEIIRLAAVIKKARKYFDTILVHTGQNYDYNLNGVFFKDLGLADPELYLDAVGADLGETMGNIIAASYKAMTELQPEAVLVLGDTNSCLSVIGAKRLHIPIFHMEAGNRCKDECLPEETNRRIVDIISDVNLAYSEHAMYIGERPEAGEPEIRRFWDLHLPIVMSVADGRYSYHALAAADGAVVSGGEPEFEACERTAGSLREFAEKFAEGTV